MKAKIFTTVLFLFLGISVFSQSTDGTVTFTVTTKTNNGQYAPKHVLAIWIKNPSGVFVRSMKVMAQQRIQYLYKWKQSSNLNTTNAITGATLTSHTTHTIQWNCKDNNGNLLPDGTYSFWVEFSELDGQGPYTSFSFTKGTSPVNLTFTNSTNFTNVSIVYTPANVAVDEIETGKAKVYQNPFSNTVSFTVPVIAAENAQIQIFTIDGKKVYESMRFWDKGNERVFEWNQNFDKSQIFIYRIESGANVYNGKFIKMY